MTAEARIDIRVTGAATAANEIGRVGQSAQSAADHASGLSDAFQYLGLTMGAAQVLGAVREWTLEADRLSDSMTRLGGRTVAFASDATYGAITQMDAAAARSRLLTAGLDLTDQQFQALTVSAAAFAQGSGQEASAVLGQLTTGLATGRTRGLEPLIGAFEEGATKADVQTEALRRLTAAADANQHQLSTNAGALDVLSLGWQKVKEGVGATFLAMLDAPFSTIIPSIHSMREALDGRQSASGALTAVATRFLALNEIVPGAGGALANYIAVTTGLTAAASSAASAQERLNAALQASRLASGLGTGTATLAPLGAPYADATGRTGAMLTTRLDGLARIQTQRRGGGGGGGGGGGDRPGARGDIDWDISMAERRRIREEAEAREAEFDAAQQASASDGLFGMTDADFYAGSTGNTGAGGGGRRGRGGGINTAATPGARNTTGPAIDNLRALERTQGLVMGNMTNAVNQHVAAWMKGEESIGKAIKSILKETLAGIAIEAAIKAVLATAEGFFALASFNYPGATAAFTAAAYYGAAAAASGAGALAVGAIGGGGGGASRSTHGRDERSSTRDLGGSSRSGGGTSPISIAIYNAPGAVIGDGGMQTFSRTLLDSINAGVRQRQPGFRLDPQVIR